METGTTPVKVFYSYSRKDRVLRKAFSNHLISLEREGKIEIWYDHCIKPGAEWEQQIAQCLESADIILLLISADFMVSEYCYKKKMESAMKRYEAHTACVIPIRLRPVDYGHAPFAKLQGLPADGSWISDNPKNKDRVLMEVAFRIRQAVDHGRASVFRQVTVCRKCAGCRFLAWTNYGWVKRTSGRLMRHGYDSRHFTWQPIQ